jgi:tetratricopeptide (TPR) repeat protein
MNKKNFGLLLFVIVLFTSCQTPIKRMSGEGFMYAMIYDYDNSPVPGVTVYLNGIKVVDSDIQGRFVLEKLRKGTHKIRLVKRGYETLEDVFYYTPMQVLYFKMINASQLLAHAEIALDNAEFVNAENILNRALTLEPNRSDILFLKSIVYHLQDRNDEAKIILENIIKSGSTDPSISQLLEIIRQTESSE